MNELIRITTDAQGASVVSARDLYDFLEIGQQFSDWIKKRIIRYGFLEGVDYVEVEGYSENLEKLSMGPDGVFHKTMKNSKEGRRATDYKLTLDMAKELSMVERNAKGKQARLYFIEAEKIARQLIEQHAPAPALSNEQLILQLMAGQQEILSQLRADVEAIKAGQHHSPTPRRVAKQLPLPGIPPARRQPTASLRSIIHQHVIEYAGVWNTTTQETYTYLYRRLYDSFGINSYRLQRVGNESILDALERYGHLDRLYSLLKAELTIPDDL